ncbi:MAG: DUF4352 domain-containing protein [Candidatus Desulforudis sp.]|nr:DUF4352 domain-containing protein [Desulforudis sp.]
MTDSNKPSLKVLATRVGIVVLVIVVILSIAWHRSQQATSLLHEVQTHVSNRQYEQALTLAQKSNEINATKNAQSWIAYCQELIASEVSFDEGLAAMESGQYEDAISAFEKVTRRDEVLYNDANQRIAEANQKLALTALDEAKVLYQDKDYIAAYQKLDKSINLDKTLEEAQQLKTAYSQAKDKQETQQREEAKKQAHIATKGRMGNYEFGTGPVGIAVTEAKSTSGVNSSYGTYRSATDPNKSHFVWLWINACNGGGSTVHVNPNYFTLSTPDGYTANYNETTFWVNCLDATDVPPDKYISGWLIFFVPKADSYTLHFRGISGAVNKEIVL